MSQRVYDPVAIARQFRFVRELPGNRGQRVEAIQRWSGGQPGDSWCCHFATMVLDIAYQGAAPVPRTGSCDEVLALARRSGWIVTDPEPGDLYLRVRHGHDAHHIGFVVEPITADRVGQISGNTSADGLSSNGDGVYERTIARSPDLVFVRVPA
jgi:hypothetical protein